MESVKKDILLLILSLFIGGLFLLSIFRTDFYFNSELDIQLHDTYFVIGTFELAMAAMGPTVFLVFLFRAIQTRGRNKLALTFLAVGAVVTGLVINMIFGI